MIPISSYITYFSLGGLSDNEFVIVIRMYPVYGFGGKVKLPNGSLSPVQHSFPVYGGGIEVQGIAGIMQVRQSLYL